MSCCKSDKPCSKCEECGLLMCVKNLKREWVSGSPCDATYMKLCIFCLRKYFLK